MALGETAEGGGDTRGHAVSPSPGDGVSRLLPAVTALLFKMEEANLASRAKAQELIQATNQVGMPWGGAGAGQGRGGGTAPVV